MNGEEIKALRVSLGLTQTEMAEYIGVKLRSVQNYEAGNTVPRGRALLKIIELSTQKNTHQDEEESLDVDLKIEDIQALNAKFKDISLLDLANYVLVRREELMQVGPFQKFILKVAYKKVKDVFEKEGGF